MIRLEATEYGYRLEVEDMLGIRGYDINTDYIDMIDDEETRDGVSSLLTEIEIICFNHGATPSAHADRQEREWKEERDEMIARANQGRI